MSKVFPTGSPSYDGLQGPRGLQFNWIHLNCMRNLSLYYNTQLSEGEYRMALAALCRIPNYQFNAYLAFLNKL